MDGPLPRATSVATIYGCWFFFLFNNTQHTGLQDNVPDFRLCCRTFAMNTVVRFFYWRMIFHVEHHMHAAVPCYDFGKLHRAILCAVPPCPHRIFATCRDRCHSGKKG